MCFKEGIIMSLKGKSGVYCIKNLENGKRYIGSSKDLGERKNTHFNNLRREVHVNKHLNASFKKYGEDAFEFFPLLFCDSEEKRIEWEKIFINKFNTFDDKYGYNVSEPGKCPDNRDERHGMWRHDVKNSEILEEFLLGLSGQEIADNLHVSRRTVNRRLNKILGKELYHKISYMRRSEKLRSIKRAQGKGSHRYDMNVPDGKLLKDLYDAGFTQTEIANAFNTTQSTVSQRIHDRKVELFYQNKIRPYFDPNFTKEETRYIL